MENLVGYGLAVIVVIGFAYFLRNRIQKSKAKGGGSSRGGGMGGTKVK